MAKTAVGAPDPGESWVALNEAQRRALLGAIDSPGFRRMIDTSANIARVYASAVEPIAKQQRAMLAATASYVRVQEQAAKVLGPALDEIQQQLTSTLRIATAFQDQTRMARAILGNDVAEAMRRVNAAASVRIGVPTEEGLSRVADLLDSGDIAQDAVAETETSISADEALSAAIDDAVDAITRSRPMLTRRRARQIVLAWVYLMWAAGVFLLNMTVPAAGAAAGALGLGAPLAAGAAGKAFDKALPPDADGGARPSDDP
jgi:hypothetical protein